MEHRHAIALSFAAAAAAFAVAARILPGWWPDRRPHSARPWTELALALLAACAVIAVGQAYQAGIRLQGNGWLAPIAESLNQILIFSPVVILVLWRSEAPKPWLRTNRVPTRIGIGLAFAVLALLVYSLAKPDQGSALDLVWWAFRYDHIDELTQVALEDLTIAAIFVRVEAALRSRAFAVILVASLFAAGHVPALLSNGASTDELLGLVTDAGIGIIAISAASRAADLAWLVPIHFVLDMTQFR